MIISGFITICTSIIQFLFSWVNLPDIPLSAQSTFDTYMSYIFEHIYKIMIWIIHKIPLSIN